MSAFEPMTFALPALLASAWRDPKRTYPLMDGESAAVERAVPKRVVEFSAGRDAARAALAELGAEPAPLLRGSDRAPIWPEGFCGSVSHSDAKCLAVAARRVDLVSVGVDLEEYAPLGRDLRDVILAAPERHVDDLAALRIFSMKEALFKALFPLTGQMMGFHEAVLCADTGGRARFELVDGLPNFPKGTEIDVTWQVAEDHVLSLCCLETGAAGA
jgi:enterobactin synthetase component D